MAINFPSNPNDGDTILVGNTTYIFDSTSGVWDASGGVTSSGSSVTEYANFAAFPTTGNTVGDFGFTQDTKALYV